MAKESSFQISPTDLFIKEAYHVVKILHKYNGLHSNNKLLIRNNFYQSLKENIAFVKLFEASFGNNILALFTQFKRQGTDTFGSIRV